MCLQGGENGGGTVVSQTLQTRTRTWVETHTCHWHAALPHELGVETEAAGPGPGHGVSREICEQHVRVQGRLHKNITSR